MHRRTAAVLLSGTLLTGVAGVAAVTPASAAVGSPSRLSAFGNALKGLVADGTLTQAQADTVAKTLADKAHGPGLGRRGPEALRAGLDQAAQVLGLTRQELVVQLRGGKTLADVARTKSVPVTDLVNALVTNAKARLATAVTDGRLTQAQADARSTNLTREITDLVNGVRPLRGPGGQGFRHGHRPADPADPTGPGSPAPTSPAPATTAPSSAQVPAAGSTTTA